MWARGLLMNQYILGAVRSVMAAAAELPHLSSENAVRSRLRSLADDILTRLDEDQKAATPEETLIGDLDRQSRDIAEDLRRVDRLMKERLGRE